MSGQEAPATDVEAIKKNMTPGEKLMFYMQAMDAGSRAFMNGDLDLAHESFVKAVDLRPEMFQPNLMLGTVLRAKDDMIGALNAFDNALKLQPKNADLLCQIGEMLYSSKLYNESLALFSEAVMADDRYTAAICGLAQVLSTLGAFKDAQILLRSAIERDSTRAELWSSLGTSCHYQNDFENATIFYQEALRLLPDIEPAKSNLELINQTKH